MKKYFTKYLPKPGGFKRVVKNYGIPVDYEQEVQLFMCSRDIQIGDKYMEHTQVKPDRYEEWIADFEAFFYEPNRIENSFRIIGPISKEATWIKEGDEFEENELLQQGTGVNITPNGGEIQVKCPTCTHFH